ncbi:RNA polymerase sigma factor, partial [Singulisphaera rosea]
MSNGAFHVVHNQIRSLFEKGTDAGRSEWQLLRRYVVENDEGAFESLVSRHGPTVLGVCRRTLDDPNDVEDAFQATFLVLVRRASSLREGDLLGPWLYGVASKVSLRARAEASLRRSRSQPGLEFAVAPEDEDSSRAELGRILDEECGRLPSKYRSTVVLCCFEGLTYEEAAHRSGCPVATLKGRLAR